MIGTDEFIPLTEATLTDLLQERYGYTESGFVDGRRRRRPRWPFPGTAEMWLNDDRGEPCHVLADALNLSPDGVGIKTDEAMEVGTRFDVAIHEPEATLYGRAEVRHCTPHADGYLVGLRFVFTT